MSDDTQTPKDIGEMIRNFRKDVGLTIAAFSELYDTSFGTVSRIENGEEWPPVARFILDAMQDAGVVLRVRSHRGKPKKRWYPRRVESAHGPKETDTENCASDHEPTDPTLGDNGKPA